MLVAKNIIKSFGNIQVLKGISLKVEKAEVVSIVGASGAGKSTLLQILGTIDKADKGDVFLNEKSLTNLNDRDLSSIRNKMMGFVFQFHHLLPEFTALENICIPAFISGLSRKKAEIKARDLLNIMDLSDRETHKPSALSGGEQQRVAIARALINNPEVVFADEPSGNLDSEASEKLHKLIFKLRKDLNQTFVIVTHNKEFANMADRKLEIVDGLI
ncbi:MAG: lipoprotein-releasing system ATP-binding protein LolD [Marinilabiliales bacterium]|nr:MAG: lipoprotein-releasing system ATP-binding protein LolD [Marinilabiliales bacterium]